jgi:hypothetical protein
LKIHVHWPPDNSTLEVIPFNTPIHFLGIDDEAGEGIDISRFSHLNLSQLSELYFGTWDPDSEEKIIGLALKSTCKELSLRCHAQLGPPSNEFFAHKVIERVVKLDIEFGM